MFAKLKGKFHLAAYLRTNTTGYHAELSHRLRQYFALPLLKPEDMKREVERLGTEIREIAVAHCTPTVIRRFNKFHNYIIKYWMQLIGPANLSVFGLHHKTNNVTERL